MADALANWQVDDGPVHLHPGDLGWHSTRGAAATAAAVRVWSRGGKLLAVGLLDGPHLLRLALDPAARDDDGLAVQVAADVSDDARGVLPAGDAAVEARGAGSLDRTLAGRGWESGEWWTPLRRDLSEAVDAPEVRLETVTARRAADWARVHWSAFRPAPPTDADLRRLEERWITMATGPFAGRARTLIARDAACDAVAVVTVWTAGPGRPGLLEPMGVHADRRRRGYGTAITVAAAAALREMGTSSALVATPSANVRAVATYRAAGFTADEPVPDRSRSA